MGTLEPWRNFNARIIRKVINNVFSAKTLFLLFVCVEKHRQAIGDTAFVSGAGIAIGGREIARKIRGDSDTGGP